MATWIYREDCGEFEARFEAATEEAAVEHVERTWRDPTDELFDGDSGHLLLVETDEDGEFETGVFAFDGINVIEDVNQMRTR